MYFGRCWVFVAVHRAFSSCSEQGLLSGCGARASHCTGFSCRRAGAVGVRASGAVVHKLSYPKACGISLDQGLNLCPLRPLSLFL